MESSLPQSPVPNSQRIQNSNGFTFSQSDAQNIVRYDLIRCTNGVDDDSLFNLGDVVVKESSVLKPFMIENTSNRYVRVQLKSNSDQIRFQTQNENLPFEDPPSNWKAVQKDEFNQMFNEINIIEFINLEPHQSIPIILVYQPRKTAESKDSSDSEDDAEIMTHSTSNLNKFSDIKASIFLTSTAIRRTSSNRSISVAYSPDMSVASFLELKVVGRLCRSVLRITTSKLTLLNCKPGETYVKDFTLSNCSEMPCLYEISCTSKRHNSNVLEISDNETGMVLADSNILRGYYRVRVRVSFKPVEEGIFDYVLQIVNKNDLNNIKHIKIQTVVSSEPHQSQTIEVTDQLKFGDCYTGSRIKQLLKIRNLSEHSVDIQLKSDMPSEISFELHTSPEGYEKEKGSHLSDSDDDLTPRQKKKPSHEFDFPSPSPMKSPLSPFIGFVGSERTAIEELTIDPATEVVIEVWYLPKRKYDQDLKAAHLHKRKFFVTVRVVDSEGRVKDTKLVEATARVCTSIIVLSKKFTDFGEARIGYTQSGVVTIINTSDLTTTVALRYQSKAVKFKQLSVDIPPKQSVDLGFDYTPRTVSPAYSKQITFINLKNIDNDQYHMIKSVNVETQRVVYHSQLFSVVTPSPNGIDFDRVIVNSPSLRHFTIKNITDDNLTLKLSSLLPDEIKLYHEGVIPPVVSPRQSPTQSKSKRRESLMDFMDGHSTQPSSTLSQSSTSRPITISRSTHLGETDDDIKQKQQWLDLAQSSPARKEKENRLYSSSPLFQHKGMMEGTDAPAHTVDLQALSKKFILPETVPIFTEPDQEEEYIAGELDKLSDLQSAITSHQISPMTILSLDPKQSRTIYVILTPSLTKRPSIQGKLRKFDSKILIELSNANEQTVTMENPFKELAVTAKICRSIMDLAQKNINFGTIQPYLQKAKTIVVNNLSEVPLAFMIRKTGKMSSLDFRIAKEDRMGVIRPYRNREIHFFFTPSFSSQYSETLVIENLHDHTNNQIVQIKANVLKPRNFYIKSLELDFGVILAGQASTIHSIVITNTSKKKRQFNVESDEHTFEACSVDMLFNADKEDQGEGELKREYRQNVNSIKVNLEPDSSKKITVVLLPNEVKDPNTRRVTYEEATGSITVYESKNRDITRRIAYIAVICYNKDIYVQFMRSLGTSINPELKIHRNFGGALGPAIVPAPSRGSSIELSPNLIDFGEVPCAQMISGLFVLKNNGLQDLNFEITTGESQSETPQASDDSKSTEKLPSMTESLKIQKIGSVPAMSNLTIPFTLLPLHAGRQTCKVFVKDVKTGQGEWLTIRASPLKPQYVKFCNIDNGSLDLGKCYINNTSNTYLAVAPLIIENVHSEPIYISAQSNLANQVFVFRDPELKLAAFADSSSELAKDDIRIESMAKSQVYVCVQPAIKSDFGYDKGRCNNLVGGVRVKVYNGNNKNLLDELFIKFNAIVGKSILQVNTNLLDLGTTRDPTKNISGTFILSNLTTQLPLKYVLKTSSNDLTLSQYDGELSGLESSNGSTKEIQFTLKPRRFGLISETVEIRNLKSLQELTLTLRLFVDEDTLTTSLSSEKGEDVLPLQVVYISGPNNETKEEKEFRPMNCEPHRFFVRNKSGEDMLLYPKSNLDIWVSWEDPTFSSHTDPEYLVAVPNRQMSGYRTCGKSFNLKSKSQVEVFLKLADKISLSTARSENLIQGKRSTQRGYFILEREVDSLQDFETEESLMRASKSVFVSFQYCLSNGKGGPSINLGKIGDANDWQNVPFTFEVYNACDILLKARRVENPTCAVELQSEDITVPPLEKKVFSAVLKTDMLNQISGPYLETLDFENTNNPLNKFSISVKAEIMTSPVKISRLEEGELLLSQILYPASSAQVENWFVVENPNDKSLEVTLKAQINEDLESYVTLELLDRSTRKPIKDSIVIPALETVSLSVSVKALGSQPPQKYAIDELVVIGQVSAFAKPSKLQLANFNLKSSFSWGPLFSLSTNRIHFDYTSYEDDPSKENQPSETLTRGFSIKNLTAEPFDYAVTPSKIPDEIILNLNSRKGTIEPYSLQIIEVSLTTKAAQMSESMSLLITGPQSSSAQVVTISILAGKKIFTPKPKKRKKHKSFAPHHYS
eukprot:TRINITY_DN2968_c0_g1_i1.p1 TRINITY_DN2968_c0_g1~~TRINITY_DN2968_c0_g1_i1.p1  ORF type:complete len:2115 (-),score=553.79 TRINITY_DN2968_c0_g1_i1:1679-8023(-)